MSTEYKKEINTDLRWVAIKLPFFVVISHFKTNYDYKYMILNVPKNPDSNMRATHEYTGLSEDAINIIKKYSEEHNEKQLIEILNTLFKEGIMTNLIKALEDFILFTSTGKLTFSYTSDKPKSIPIDPKIIAEWFLDIELERATEKIKEILLEKYSYLYEKEDSE